MSIATRGSAATGEGFAIRLVPRYMMIMSSGVHDLQHTETYAQPAA